VRVLGIGVAKNLSWRGHSWETEGP